MIEGNITNLKYTDIWVASRLMNNIFLGFEIIAMILFIIDNATNLGVNSWRERSMKLPIFPEVLLMDLHFVPLFIRFD